MAEGLLRAALQSHPDLDVSVVSAGVSAMPGDQVSRETQDILLAKSAGLTGFRSQQVDESLLTQADLVIAMTASHADVVTRYFGATRESVHLMCDFIPTEEGLAGADIPDPIGMGPQAYREVAEVMALAVPEIIKQMS